MIIRKAKDKDAKDIIRLLSQVLEIHAVIRPDIFISGTTKYTEQEVIDIINDENRLTFVVADDNDKVIAYALCIIQEQPFLNNMVAFKSLFIDDLCVDQSARGQKIGSKLFNYVKNEAKKMGFYELTLNVWEGNDSAKSFYDKMGMKTKESQLELIL